jgi:hypothetical protein
MKKLFLLLILFTFAGASNLIKSDANAMGLKSRNAVDTISLPAPGLSRTG